MHQQFVLLPHEHFSTLKLRCKDSSMEAFYWSLKSLRVWMCMKTLYICTSICFPQMLRLACPRPAVRGWWRWMQWAWSTHWSAAVTGASPTWRSSNWLSAFCLTWPRYQLASMSLSYTLYHVCVCATWMHEILHDCLFFSMTKPYPMCLLRVRLTSYWTWCRYTERRASSSTGHVLLLVFWE